MTDRVEKAREQGRQAALAGKPVGSCPYRGYTPLVRQLAQAFRQGHEAGRMERRR